MKFIETIRRPFFEIYLFIFVLILTFIYTYPLITDVSGTFLGWPGDPLGGIWEIWWYKFSYSNNISFLAHNYQAYPFGVDLSSSVFSYITYMQKLLLGFITNEVAVYNIIKLLNFPLLALTTYLLLYSLTKDRISSAFVGIAFSFSPFHVIHNMIHFVDLYWVPLVLLFLIKLLKHGGYWTAVFLGLTGGVCFIFNAYYPYFIGLLAPFFIIAYLIDKERRSCILNASFLKALMVSGIIFIIVVLPEVYPIVKVIFNSNYSSAIQDGGLSRGFSDLFIFSAKPLDYLFPSKHNPFLGRLIPDMGMGPLKGHRYTEHTLYLGYTLLFLAGYAVYNVLRKKGHYYDDEARHSIKMFVIVGIAAVILSAPPFIPLGEYKVDFLTREVVAENKILLPQYFLFKLFPMFRVYARMGVMVLLAVCVLAAFGLSYLVSKTNSTKGKSILFLLLSMILFIEFAEFPDFRLTKIHKPEVYKWLASQPEQFPIVEYPLGDGFDPYTTYEYKFNQRIHEKFLVNGATKGTPADEFRKEIIDPSAEDTVDKLKDIGVKYIILHKYKYVKGNEFVSLDWLTTVPDDKIYPAEYNNGIIPDMGRVQGKVRLVEDFGVSAIYEII